MRPFLLGLLAILWSTSAMAVNLYTFNGGGTSGNWTDATIWTTDPTGSTRINSSVPGNGDNVTVTNSFIVYVPAAISTTGLNITIQRGGTLDLTTASSTFATLSSLSGQGTLRIAAPYFPTVTTNNFSLATGGTVEYYNWTGGSTNALPTTATAYNNLRFLNTGVGAIGNAFTVQLDNNLTVNGNLTFLRASTTTTGTFITFNLGKTGTTARTLSVLGNINVGEGTQLGVSAINAVHTINASGSFTNNGIVNLRNGADTQAALLNFTGTNKASFVCNAPTDLDILQVNKGIDSQVLLDITAATNFSSTLGFLHLNHTGPGDILVLVNGITKLGQNINLPIIHNGNPNDLTINSGWYQLGTDIGGGNYSSPTMWIDGATLNNDNANAELFVIYGVLRISGGTLTSKNDGGLVIREDGQFLMEGGNAYVNKFRPSSAASPRTHRGSFTMSGGLLSVDGTLYPNSTFPDGFARFALPYTGQAFRMSGGTIEVRTPNPTQSFNTTSLDGFFHVGVDPNNVSVTGGTIKLYLPSTATPCKVLSSAPLWNLSIIREATGGTSTAVISAINIGYPTNAVDAIKPLTVLNDLSLGTGTNFPVTFDTNGQNLTIQGSFNIGSATNTGCTYLTGTNTTIFAGAKNQQLTNYGTIGAGPANSAQFNNWTIDKSAGTLTLGGSAPTAPITGATNAGYYTLAGTTLALLDGVLNDGGKTVYVRGNITNSAVHTSTGSGSITMNGAAAQTINGDGTGVFATLNIESLMTTGTVAVTLAANMAISNALNLNTVHILSIGAYRLSITNVDPAAISAPNGFSSSSMIQTSGNQSDLGLQKTYASNGLSFVFPVGVAGRYMPATFTLNGFISSGQYGQVSVSPVDKRNPFVSSAATGTNALNYFWKVRSTGFGTGATADPNNPQLGALVNADFRIIDADAPVGFKTGGNYVLGIYNPVTWATATPTSFQTSTTGSTIIKFSGLSQFAGEYTFGTTTPQAFGTITSFYSVVNSGTWASPSTWNTSTDGGVTLTAASSAPGAGNPVFVGTTTAIGSPATKYYSTITVAANAAQAGSLVIDRGSVLDVGITTGHNFGELPDSKVGGAGRLRVSGTTTVTFPGGDFGSFMQYGGGTVEYYTTGANDFTLPTTSGTVVLNQYRNLWLNAATGRTITLPAQDLRIYAQLKSGADGTTTNGNGAAGGPGKVLMSAAAAGNLRVDSLLQVHAGTLSFPNTTVRTVNADTDVQIDAAGNFIVANTTNQTHTLTLGGSLTNNNVLNFNPGTGKVALTFTGAVNKVLTGPTGTNTSLYSLTLNKGTGRAATLSVDVAGTLATPLNSWLNITNGTLRFAKSSGTLNIHNLFSTYLIADNAGLTVDGPSAIVNIATGNDVASDVKLAGQIQVLQGTLNVGASGNVGNDLEYASAGAPGLKVAAGGTLYVNGQIRRTVNNLDGSLRYDQSGGAVDIDGQGATATLNNERGLFEVQGLGSIFRMSAGTITLHRSNGKSPITTPDFYLAPDSTVVTGGTVVLGNTGATAGSVNISLSSKVPLFDLKVEANTSTSTNTGTLAGILPLTLKSSLTIGNDKSFFNANGLPLNIYQSLINNNTSASTALNVGGFQPSTTTQTTSFLGGIATQLITGTTSNLTVFGNLVMNTPQALGTLQLGGNVRVAGDLTLTKGTLDDNTKTITVLGNVLNSATHISSGAGSLTLAGTANQNVGGNGTGKFGNLVLNNAAGATTTANQQVTSVLTLTSGVLTIGSNLLYLSNTATTAIGGTPSLSNYIRTNGIVADLGVRKAYIANPGTAQNFTFPIGASTKYNPVSMNVQSNTNGGNITVQAIDLAHPSLTTTGNELSFYWKVTSTLGSPVVSQLFNYSNSDVVGAASTYRVGRFYAGAWVPVNGITTSSVNTATNTLSNPTYAGVNGIIDGDYTGAAPVEFGVVPTFYSRNATAGQPAGANWDAPSTLANNSWTFNSDGTDSSPLPGTYPTLANPVVILSGHLINSNGPSRGAATLLLNGTLDLGTNAANNFNNVSGTGTLRIGSALFPAGNYANFVAPSTGTIEYNGAIQLPARDTYNNLTLSGGTAKQLTNLDLTINGALSVTSGTSVDNVTSQNLSLTSSAATSLIDGTFLLEDGNLTTGTSLTVGSNGTLTLGAGAVTIGQSLATLAGGTINQATGAVQVTTSLNNAGTYEATVAKGNVAVGTTFSNSGTYNAGYGKLDVTGSLTNTGTFNAGYGEVNSGGVFTNAAGTYTATQSNIVHANDNFINQATFKAGASNIVLRSNFTNSGTFTPGSSLVQFITDVNRFLNGNTTFYNLQKLGNSALTMGTSTDVHVTNLMTIQNSVVYTGTNTNNILYLDNVNIQPVVGYTATSYVVGRLAIAFPNATTASRIYPVGGGQRYRPVTINNGTSSTGTAKVLVEVITGTPPGTRGSGFENLSYTRYYRIHSIQGTMGNSAAIQLSFNTDVVDETVNVPGNLRIAKTTVGTANTFPSGGNTWNLAGGTGVFSPDFPKGYTTSQASLTGIGSASASTYTFYSLASTSATDNPLSNPGPPLPVELRSFTAARQGNAVRVDWATASEKNSAYFVVQRSANGRTFSDIRRVKALGSSTSLHGYNMLDESPLMGMSYYRLLQVDNDGSMSYSSVALVRFDQKASAPALLAYPNPASGTGFQLTAVNLTIPGGTVQVFDNTGRVVLTQVLSAMTADANIQPLQPLAAGMYYVTWKTLDGTKLTTKVVVE